MKSKNTNLSRLFPRGRPHADQMVKNSSCVYPLPTLESHTYRSGFANALLVTFPNFHSAILSLLASPHLHGFAFHNSYSVRYAISDAIRDATHVCSSSTRHRHCTTTAVCSVCRPDFPSWRFLSGYQIELRTCCSCERRVQMQEQRCSLFHAVLAMQS